MSKSKRQLSPAEKDSRLKVKGPKTAARKQANVLANTIRRDDNVQFVINNRIELQVTKQTVVTKDREGHRVTKTVEKLEKPSQAIRRYWREQHPKGDKSPVYDPQQANHPGRSTKATRQAKVKAVEARAKSALESYLTKLS